MSSSEMLLDAKRGTIQNTNQSSRARRTVEVAQARGKTIVRRQNESDDADTVEFDMPGMPANRSAPADRDSRDHEADGTASRAKPDLEDIATGLSSAGVSSGGSTVGFGKHSALADHLRGQTGGSAVDADDELVEVAEARVKPRTGDTVDRTAPAMVRFAGVFTWVAIAAAAFGVAIAAYLVFTGQEDSPLQSRASDVQVDQDPAKQAGLNALAQARELEAQGHISDAWSALQTYKMTAPVEAWPQGLLGEVNRLESKLADTR